MGTATVGRWELRQRRGESEHPRSSSGAVSALTRRVSPVIRIGVGKQRVCRSI